MTNKRSISILDEQTINQIAAGEVVENSSSVVKELVENSLDAGASEIVVETLGGGRGLIRVTDNGSGMNKDEQLLSLQRHATSKILKAEDLETIGTLGFRGEALPSIASVSKMKLCSEVEIEVEGGVVCSITPKPREQGTSIEVRSLFFNTPVRRKFQKSPAFDTGEIHKMLIRLALCHPGIQFRWINEGEERLFVEKNDNLERRIQSLLSLEFVHKEVDCKEDGMRLFGFLGGHRATRTGQYLFVNGRFVFSPYISKCVLEGFATRLPSNRFPIFVLHLEVPRDWVDVNVHPQKREVRFREQERVGNFVRKIVDQALHVKPAPICFDPLPLSSSFHKWEQPAFEERHGVNPFRDDFIRESHFEQLELIETIHPIAIIGGFLLLHVEEGIQVVDLNRARALLMEKAEEISMQKLLIPVMLEFDEYEKVVEKLPFLEKCGFALRPFGGKSFACEAIPAHLEQEEAKAVIEGLSEARTLFGRLRKCRFTMEEGKRLAEELFAKGYGKEATSLITEEELAKRFKS